jgi:hypothetical protein
VQCGLFNDRISVGYPKSYSITVFLVKRIRGFLSQVTAPTCAVTVKNMMVKVLAAKNYA